MDPEMKRQFDELHALVRDNHHLLRAVRRHQIVQMWWRIIFWVVVIVLSFYGYIAYLNPLVNAFISSPGEASSTSLFPSSAELRKLINSYKDTR